MIQIKTLEVNNLDYNTNVLSWELESTEEDLSEYKVDIYKSEYPGDFVSFDGFSIIASGISVSSYIFNDVTISGYGNFHRQWYYKFNVKNTVTSEESIQPEKAAYIKNHITDYAVREIIRRKRIPLQPRYSGRVFSLLKRVTTGAHCTRCWDTELFRVTDPNCPVCYGTGYTGGYFTPMTFYGTVTTAPKYNEITMFGEWKPSDVLLRILDFPQLQPKDVLLDDNGNRWIVFQIRKIEKMGFLLEQNIQMALIAPDDVIYTYNVPLISPITSIDYYTARYKDFIYFIDCVAAEDIPSFSTVYISGNREVKILDVTNLSESRKSIGLSANSASAGQMIRVCTAGIIKNSAWSFTAGSLIYASGTGSVSASVPTSGAVITIGSAVSANEILVNTRPFIVLS